MTDEQVKVVMQIERDIAFLEDVALEIPDHDGR